MVELPRDISQAFGLTYASYLVVPRVVLEAMPLSWQHQFVALMEQLHDTLDYDEPNYCVLARNAQGRYITDELRHYRRPVPGLVRQRIA